MDNNTFLKQIPTQDYVGTLILLATVVIMIISLMINVGLVIKCGIWGWSTYKKYIICKKSPNLHPIYSDVQFLSQQRKLYNLKTHLIKYIIATCCGSIEVMGFLWMGMTNLFYSLNLANNNDTQILEYILDQSKCQELKSELYDQPLYILFYNFNYIFLFLLLLLFSILTRFLAARYYTHPSKRIVMKYIAWFSVECILVAICSSKYTIIISAVLIPLLVHINWFLLVRDSLILSRVLKCKINEIRLYSDNTIFYKQQMAAFRLYRIFRIWLLLALYLLALTITLLYATFMVEFIINNFCLFKLIYGIQALDISVSIQTREFVEDILTTLQISLLLLFTLAHSLPLWFITLSPLITKCIKRLEDREENYRFNYDRLHLLMGRNNYVN